MTQSSPRLDFHRGTILWTAPPELPVPPGFVHDDRVDRWRAPAREYRKAVEWLRSRGMPFSDAARAWKPLPSLRHLAQRDAREYQAEALEAWKAARCTGVVVLPTGSGKTYLAEMCIAHLRRPTLVVVPTIDLLAQWHRRLVTAFGDPVGMLGGGSHYLAPMTVSTYASAYLHAERYGDRFGFVVFDEVHHLPSEQHMLVADCLMAPFRLGLSATPERADEAHLLLDDLVGPMVYRKDIGQLSGEFLASYETVRLNILLSDDELREYHKARNKYRDFVKSKRISMRGPNAWQRFIQVAARSKAGLEALKAWRRSRQIIHGTERKLDLLEDLFQEHAGRRTLVFTDDNATAYRISREFLVPCITHQTPAQERSTILACLESGQYSVVVTSRVLNEGVDLPEAEVAIVVSGTGSVREHVQRLGRILRPGEGKHAVLYEMVASGTVEERTSERRRDHEAYR